MRAPMRTAGFAPSYSTHGRTQTKRGALRGGGFQASIGAVGNRPNHYEILTNFATFTLTPAPRRRQ
ncbi:hypothetical protein BO443_10795 [Burkholderia orbicola]